jgi:hypothetical protein
MSRLFTGPRRGTLGSFETPDVGIFFLKKMQFDFFGGEIWQRDIRIGRMLQGKKKSICLTDPATLTLRRTWRQVNTS